MVRPSGKITETKVPPGSPVWSGWAATVTLSPGLRNVDFQPARMRTAGEVISMSQTSTPPLELGTSISIHECGFAHLKYLTVPTSVTVLFRSNPAIEWCAKAELEAHIPNKNVHAISTFFTRFPAFLGLK